MPVPRTFEACRRLIVLLAVMALSVTTTSPIPAEEAMGRAADIAQVLADLGSPEPAVRLGAAKRLPELAIELWTRDFDATSSVLLTVLDDASSEVRQMAAVSLFQATWVIWGNVELSADQEAVREEASPKLRRLHPRFVDRLDDDDPIVREYLLRALGSWMPNLPQGLSTRLLHVVDDPSPKVAGLALRVLGRAGERSEAVISKVLGALDRRPELRATAVDVLADLYDEPAESEGRSPAPVDVLDSLSAAAADPDEAVQMAAIRALGRVGAGSESVRALLRTHADSGSERLRLEADLALSRLDADGPSPGDIEEP
ncbi:MAG: HEAT repeat domain-containing protein [Acidobacteriota bacterium]